MTSSSSDPSTDRTRSPKNQDSQTTKAASVAVMRGQEVLLVRRGLGSGAGLWAFPGGKVETGEALEQTASRELLEETGVTASISGRLASYDINAGTRQFALTVFAAEYLSGEASAGDDAVEARWFTLSAAMSLPLAEHMADALGRL